MFFRHNSNMGKQNTGYFDYFGSSGQFVRIRKTDGQDRMPLFSSTFYLRHLRSLRHSSGKHKKRGEGSLVYFRRHSGHFVIIHKQRQAGIKINPERSMLCLKDVFVIVVMSSVYDFLTTSPSRRPHLCPRLTTPLEHEQKSPIWTITWIESFLPLCGYQSRVDEQQVFYKRDRQEYEHEGFLYMVRTAITALYYRKTPSSSNTQTLFVPDVVVIPLRVISFKECPQTAPFSHPLVSRVTGSRKQGYLFAYPKDVLNRYDYTCHHPWLARVLGDQRSYSILDTFS